MDDYHDMHTGWTKRLVSSMISHLFCYSSMLDSRVYARAHPGFLIHGIVQITLLFGILSSLAYPRAQFGPLRSHHWMDHTTCPDCFSALALISPGSKVS